MSSEMFVRVQLLVWEDSSATTANIIAHPAVEGILMWGFWEGANWIPASSLYKKDWTSTPAAEAYQSLIYDEWWTNTSAKAGDNGMCEIPAFYGTHKVIVNGVEKTVKLSKASGSSYIDMRKP